MAVSVTDIVAGPFTPNGVARSFHFDFKIPSATELRVYSLLAGVEATLSSALYSVELDGDGEGGTAVFTVAPASALGEIYIEAVPLFTQEAVFTNSGFLPATLGPQLDRSVLRDLYLKDRLDRALVMPRGAGFVWPPASERTGNQILAFNNETGEPEVKSGAEFIGSPGANVMAISSFATAAASSIPVGTTTVRTTEGTDYVEFDLGSGALNDAFLAGSPLLGFKSANARYFRLSLNQRITALMGGMVADTIVAAANNATRLDALAAYVAGRTIFFGRGDWHFARALARGHALCLAGAGQARGTDSTNYVTSIIFSAQVAGTFLIDNYSTVPSLLATDTVVTLEDIAFRMDASIAAGCGLLRLGRRDIDLDGTDDPTTDGTVQRYQVAHRISRCMFAGSRIFEANTTTLATSLGTQILIDMAKCFSAVIEYCDFTGGDIQIRTYGCDHPQIRGNRFLYAAIPIWLEASGSLGVLHALNQNQIETWGLAGVVVIGVAAEITGRIEQNIANIETGKDARAWDLTADSAITASVTAGSKTVTFSASMTGKLIPNVSVLTFSRGWEAYDGVVSAGGTGHVAGDVVTFSDGTKVRVSAVSGGAITYFQILVNGLATAGSAKPTGAKAQSATTGVGIGATITFEWRSADEFSALVRAVSGVTVTLKASSATDAVVPYGDESLIVPWTLAAARVTRVQGMFALVDTLIDCMISVNGAPNGAPLLVWLGGRSSIHLVGCGTSGHSHIDGGRGVLLATNQANNAVQYTQAGVHFQGVTPVLIGDPAHPHAIVHFQSQQGTLISGNRHMQVSGFDGMGARRRWRFTPKSYMEFNNNNNRMLMARIPDPGAGDGYSWCWALDGAGDIVSGVALNNTFGLNNKNFPKQGYVRIRMRIKAGVPNSSKSYLAVYGGALLINKVLGYEFEVHEWVGAVPASWSSLAYNGSALVAGRDTALSWLACVDVEELSLADARAIPKATATKSAFNFASIANGAQASTTVTVTGAAVGDRVEVMPAGDVLGLNVWGRVTATDTVTIFAGNTTGGAADPAAMDYLVVVYWTPA